MNRLFYHMKKPSFLILSGMLMVSCTDGDFDLSHIDTTIGVGSEALQLPISNTNQITLDNILDIDGSDIIFKDEATGYYSLFKEDHSISPTTISIDQPSFTISGEYNYQLKLDMPSSISAAKTNRAPRRISASGGFSSSFKAVEYETEAGTVTDAIESLSRLGVDSKINFHLSCSDVLKQSDASLTRVTLKLPKYMILAQPQLPSHVEKVELSADGHSVILTNVSGSDDIFLQIPVTALDFNIGADQPNVLKFTKGKSVEVVAYMEITGDYLVKDPKSTNLDDYYLSMKFSGEPIVITSATGKFNPEIELHNIGDVTLNNVPEFLTEKEVAIHLENPQVILTIGSDLPLGGSISGTIKSFDENGRELAHVNVDGLKVESNATSRICICRHPDEIDPSHYTFVKQVDNLSDILKVIPYRLSFDVNAAADKNTEATILLGNSYTLSPSFEFRAPLTFDEGSLIVYRDTVDGWNDDIKDFSLVKGSYLQATIDADNGIPAEIEVSAVAMDVNKTVIPEDQIMVKADKNVEKSVDGVTRKVTEVQLRAEEMVPGSMKRMDGLIYTLKARPTKGVQLNAKTQTLLLKNIRVVLIGKAAADLN